MDRELDENPEEDHELNFFLEEYWSSVRTRHLTGRPVQDLYNFRLIGSRRIGAPVNMEAGLRAVFQQLRQRVKMNVSFGLVLRNSVTGELRYFHPCHNNARFFEEPFVIASEANLEAMIRALNEADIVEHGRRQRPDTKWSVEAITNINVFVNKTDYVIGASQTDLPPFVANNTGLIKLQRNRHTGKRYEDTLCFFAV